MGLGSLSEEQVCLKSGSWMAAILGGLLILLSRVFPTQLFIMAAIAFLTSTYLLHYCSKIPPLENVLGEQSLLLLLPPDTFLLPKGCLHRTYHPSRPLFFLCLLLLAAAAPLGGDAGRMLLECAKTHSLCEAQR